MIIKFSIPKKGNIKTENEDAALFYDKIDSFSIAAISDGATEATFSKIWANTLIESCIKNTADFINVNNETFDKARADFIKKIDLNTLPWYAQNKFFDQGSYATFGRVIVDKSKKIIDIVVVGDIGIFVETGKNENGIFFPQESSEEFGNAPYLVSSISSKNIEMEANIKHLTLDYLHYHSIFMMTDALAAWFLEKHLAGQNPKEILEDIETLDEFEIFIDTLRTNKEIRNDDTTLVVINNFLKKQKGR